jgi:hypothetical protein
MMHLADHYQQDQITGAASAGTGLESCHLGSWPCLPPPLSTLDAGEFEPDAVSGDCRRDTSILFSSFPTLVSIVATASLREPLVLQPS